VAPAQQSKKKGGKAAPIGIYKIEQQARRHFEETRRRA
jgi:hypothetical protein